MKNLRALFILTGAAAAAIIAMATPAFAYVLPEPPGPGDVYFLCMQRLWTNADGDGLNSALRKSILDHAAEACVAAEANWHLPPKSKS
jgi:hypothetical protein